MIFSHGQTRTNTDGREPVFRLARFILILVLLIGSQPIRARAARQSPTPAPVSAGRVSFVGNSSFPAPALTAAIAAQIREIDEGGLTPPRADDAAFYVGAFYRKAGFSKAEVEYAIRGSTLVLAIKEGPRSLLRKITYVGNRAIPAATLDQYMIGATADRLVAEPAQFPFTEAQIADGVNRVRGLYLSQGFLNVAVASDGARFFEGNTRAEITVQITEGTRFTFGEIRFAGDTLFPREELLKALGEPTTGPFSPGTATAMQRNLHSFFKGRGYYLAEVAVVADPALAKGGKVMATFTIQAKGLFRFDGVTVNNETKNPRLRPDFLPKRFAHLRGEIYHPEKLDETFREMLRTGLFENLRVAPTPIPGEQIRLDLTASEAMAKELGFTIGYGSYEGGTVGFRAGDRDLYGLGRPLTFAADYSQRGISGELLYVDPWLFDGPLSLRARLYSVARDEEGYSKQEVGLRVDLTRKFLPHLELGVFIDSSKVSITDSTIDPQFLGLLDYTLTSVGITQTTDFRDDPINPGRGFILTSGFDFALIEGEPGFTRSALRISYYLPLGKTLLSLGARAGYIAPIVDSVPIDERYFNGGSNSVRSFAERKLGPKDRSENPLGGESFTVLNVEYTFPLVSALQGAVFVDAGSLSIPDAEDSGRMRYALGAGLRYKLPIGPLRLDYGLNPNRRANEEIGAFHFSFGFAF